jgi:hypothetical protein
MLSRHGPARRPLVRNTSLTQVRQGGSVRELPEGRVPGQLVLLSPSASHGGCHKAPQTRCLPHTHAPSCSSGNESLG